MRLRCAWGKAGWRCCAFAFARGLRSLKASPWRGRVGPGGLMFPLGLTIAAIPDARSARAAMSSAGFVHLHVHSAYSLLKGSIKIQKLGELAKADRQPALALTDTDNMFGALEFSDKMAGYGIQPIIGCELAIDFGDQDPNARNALAVGAFANRVAGGARARLSQPDAAELAGVSGDAGPSVPAHQVRMARGRCRGPDRADRRPGRADLAGDAWRSCRARRDALRPAGEPVRRPPLCRIAASRHRARSAAPRPA